MSPELHEVMAALARIERKVDAMAAAPSAVSASVYGGNVADDRDLDSEWGDPVVKNDPKRWTGDSYAGSRFSECPAEYLDQLAGLFDWMANKDDAAGKTWTNKKGEDIPASSFKRKDAARARGWAARIRAGKVTQVVADRNASSDSSDIPF